MSPETPSKLFELCPPPPVTEAVPPTSRVLEALLSERGEEVDLLFALGCVYLRRGESAAGVDIFLRALKLDSENPELHCNLAVAYMQEERWDEASATLKRAILLRPNLELALSHLATTEVQRGDIPAAKAAYESAIALDVNLSDPCYQLAELLFEQGERDESRRWFEEAFRRGDRRPELLNTLGAFRFEDGLLHYEAGEFEEALGVWGAAYAEFERAFIANQAVSTRLNALVKVFNEEQQLEVYSRKLQSAEKEEYQELLYGFSLRLFFSLGCMPDLYVPKERLSEEFLRWEREIERAEDAIIPFAHYRIAVLKVYCGEFEAAIEKLSFARDHLPPSKHRPLRIEACLRFLKDFLGEKDEGESATREYTKAEWEASGFGDPFQFQAWRVTGVSPEDAVVWKKSGFSPKSAARWHASGIEASVAREWLDAGFEEPNNVRRWLRGGFDTTSALQWRPEFGHRLELAVQCRQAGFTQPDEAARWLSVFTFPWEAEAWKLQGFSPEQAKEFKAAGVKDPFIAKQQQAENESK